MDISFAIGIIYYLFYFFGAGSIGYLLVRITYPDIRILDKDAKLGISAILGFIIMVIACAGEYVFGLFFLQGLMPLLSMIIVLVTFGIMKVYFFVNSPRMLTIGLPVHSASKAAKAAAAVEQSVQPQKPVKPVQQHVAADESKPFV
ncbi:MAG: hypothetical protein WC408_05580, partial [Candidatus Micrarchaeia archaeon]